MHEREHDALVDACIRLQDGEEEPVLEYTTTKAILLLSSGVESVWRLLDYHT